jgi:hypothetical protein
MKGKRREDPRSLLRDMRMLALSAYARQFKILLDLIDVAHSYRCSIRAGDRRATVDALAAAATSNFQPPISAVILETRLSAGLAGG